MATIQGLHRFFKTQVKPSGFSYFHCFSCLMYIEIDQSTANFIQIEQSTKDHQKLEIFSANVENEMCKKYLASLALDFFVS
jgi:hypothetical protein